MTEDRTNSPVLWSFFKNVAGYVAQAPARRRGRKPDRWNRTDLRHLSAHTKRDIGWTDI